MKITTGTNPDERHFELRSDAPGRALPIRLTLWGKASYYEYTDRHGEPQRRRNQSGMTFSLSLDDLRALKGLLATIDTESSAASQHYIETGELTIIEPDRQECDACGDEVHTLSSDGLCDGCVAEQVAAGSQPRVKVWLEQEGNRLVLHYESAEEIDVATQHRPERKEHQ